MRVNHISIVGLCGYWVGFVRCRDYGTCSACIGSVFILGSMFDDEEDCRRSVLYSSLDQIDNVLNSPIVEPLGVDGRSVFNFTASL